REEDDRAADRGDAERDHEKDPHDRRVVTRARGDRRAVDEDRLAFARDVARDLEVLRDRLVLARAIGRGALHSLRRALQDDAAAIAHRRWRALRGVGSGGGGSGWRSSATRTLRSNVNDSSRGS